MNSQNGTSANSSFTLVSTYDRKRGKLVPVNPTPTKPNKPAKGWVLWMDGVPHDGDGAREQRRWRKHSVSA